VIIMSERQWMPLTESEEGALIEEKVERSGLMELRRMDWSDLAPGEPQRESTTITYEVKGGWKGIFQHAGVTYDTITVPAKEKRGQSSAKVGEPEIPTVIVPVPVPDGARDVTIEVVDKRMKRLEGQWRLKPVADWVMEEGYLAGEEEYHPNAEIYDSEEEYPGVDFEYHGLKRFGNVTLAHLTVYLAQYKPASGTLSLVETITLEISYEVPPSEGTGGPFSEGWGISPMMRGLVLDFENALGDKEDTDESLDAWDATFKLRRRNIYSKYIIITPASLEAAVEPLLKAKSRWPYYAMVATTEAIRAEFPARLLKDSIRTFLKWAWDNWRGRPQYVVLAGDSDVIPVDKFAVEVPERRGGRRVMVSKTFASDHYYADLNDSLAPELVVSRIPTSHESEMKQICRRLAQYADLREATHGKWEKEVVLVAFQDDVYKDCCDTIAGDIFSRFEVTKRYGDASTTQQVVEEMNQGALIVNYRGHGDKTSWQSSNGLKTGHIRSLNNENKPPMVFCICCQNAWIDDENTETVVEAFLRKGKAVAVLGASRNSPTRANNDFDEYLFQAIMDGGEITPGLVTMRAKTMMVLNHPNSVPHELDVKMYLLFGDPTAVLTVI
jgi:hypothetical protein